MTWISVCDDLPKEPHEVLVYTPEHQNIYIAYWSGVEGIWMMCAPGICYRTFPQWVEITHWMPLPELPKEEEHDMDEC